MIFKSRSEREKEMTSIVGQPMGVYKPNPSPSSLPLRTDVIRAYRAYNIKWDRGRPLLMGSREPWTTTDKTAACAGNVTKCEEHLSSLAECGCGIYALTKREDAYGGPVVADVVLFGIVWPHTHGYKASKARIESLAYTPSSDSQWEAEIVTALAAAYNVPVAMGALKERGEANPDLVWKVAWTGYGPQGYGAYYLDGPGGTVGTYIGPTTTQNPGSITGGVMTRAMTRFPLKCSFCGIYKTAPGKCAVCGRK